MLQLTAPLALNWEQANATCACDELAGVTSRHHWSSWPVGQFTGRASRPRKVVRVTAAVAVGAQTRLRPALRTHVDTNRISVPLDRVSMRKPAMV